MNIEMIGIDYKLAGIELREQLSFNQSQIKEILVRLQHDFDLSGIIILSTCNRTEFYLSYKDGQSKITLTELLQHIAPKSSVCDTKYFHCKDNMQVAQYLFEVAAGTHSMIFGDDQIVSQIKSALQLANICKSSDAVLNTMFRHAITCGKVVKSTIVLRAVSSSVATQCTKILKDFIAQQKHKPRALVIGNGEIGRTVCRELIKAGCHVFMTLRKYKHAQVKIPAGCTVVDYYERSNYFETMDIIVSATASPHHTITYEMIADLQSKPAYLLDLAVPRDIEAKVQTISDIEHYDIDRIGQKALRDNRKELAQITDIIQEQLRKFSEWLIFHKCSQELTEVKQLAQHKILQNINDTMDEQSKLERAINKTVEFIFYSMKEQKSKELLNEIKSVAISKGY